MVNIVDGIRRMARIMSGKDENPTGVTAAQLGTYSKEEVDAKLDGLVSSVDMQLSQYGDTSFLPVNVSGSFEGSANNGKSAFAFKEADGRVYGLRNGVDGRIDGAYFVEIEMDQNGVGTEVKGTSIPYHPPFLPEGTRINRIWYSYKDQIYGQLYLGNGKYCLFIAYTNYTMNQDLHTGIILRGTTGNGDNTIWEEGGTIYRTTLFNDNRGTGVYIHTIPVSDLNSEWIQLQGWSGIGIEGHNYSNEPFIKLADRPQKMIGDSVIAYSATPENINGLGITQTWPQVEVYPTGPGKYALVYGHETWVSHVNGSSDRKFSARRINIDVNTKTYELAEGRRSPIIVEVKADGKVNLTSTDQIYISRDDFDGAWLGNVPCWVTCNPKGLLVSYVGFNAMQNMWYIEEGRTQAELMDLGNRRINRKRAMLDYRNVFGSAVQGSLFTPNVWDSDSLCVSNSVYQLMRNNMSGWAINDTFTLPYGQVLNSVTLSQDRERITGTKRPMNEMVTEIVNDIVYKSTALFWDGKFTGLANVANALDEGNTPVSITEAQFRAIEAHAVSLAIANQGPTDWVKTIVVIPQHSRIPPFATTFFSSKMNKIYQLRQSLDFKGVKTGALPDPGFKEEVWTICREAANTLNLGYLSNDAFHGITMADYDTFSVVGGCGVAYADWVGNGGGIGSLWKYKDGLWQAKYFETSQRHTTDAPYPLPIPKVGVVGFSNSLDRDVSYTNLTGAVIGKDEARIDNIGTHINETPTLFLTNAVVNGWVVYFTEETPVTIGNVSGTTVVQNIDLEAVFGAKPTNRKFLVYVRLENGVFGHAIVAEPVTDDNFLFVGYVYTGNDGIRSIEVNKVIGINGYVLSGSKRGSAIAVTDGNPNGPGTFKWK